jgi:hypothetical protein
MSSMLRSREQAALKRVQALQYASMESEKLAVIRRLPPLLSSRDETDDALTHHWSWLEKWVGFQPFDKDVPVAHQLPYSAASGAAGHGDDADRLGCSALRSFVRPRCAPAWAGDYYYEDVATSCLTSPVAAAWSGGAAPGTSRLETAGRCTWCEDQDSCRDDDVRAARLRRLRLLRIQGNPPLRRRRARPSPRISRLEYGEGCLRPHTGGRREAGAGMRLCVGSTSE